MISEGIIWNKGYILKNDILRDISTNNNIIDIQDYNFDDEYESFVRNVYSIENMESWKIDKKLAHMLDCVDRKICSLSFEFDESNVLYHPMKKKMVYADLENLKMFIREKYKTQVDNYTFDVLFHATDSKEELIGLQKLLCSYKEYEINYKDSKILEYVPKR